MALKFRLSGGICCNCHCDPWGLKKSWRTGRRKPCAQVKLALAWRPCERRLVALICKESYLESPVGELDGSIAPNCGNGYSVLSSELNVLKLAYGRRLVIPRAAMVLITCGLLMGCVVRRKSA